jgi:hypothetical protein
LELVAAIFRWLSALLEAVADRLDIVREVARVARSLHEGAKADDDDR